MIFQLLSACHGGSHAALRVLLQLCPVPCRMQLDSIRIRFIYSYPSTLIKRTSLLWAAATLCLGSAANSANLDTPERFLSALIQILT